MEFTYKIYDKHYQPERVVWTMAAEGIRVGTVSRKDNLVCQAYQNPQEWEAPEDFALKRFKERIDAHRAEIDRYQTVIDKLTQPSLF